MATMIASAAVLPPLYGVGGFAPLSVRRRSLRFGGGRSCAARASFSPESHSSTTCPLPSVQSFQLGRNHPQVSYFLKPKQRVRLGATARAELQAVVAEDATEAITVPATFPSSNFTTTPVDLPVADDLELVDRAGADFSQEGILDVDSSSPSNSGDVPAPEITPEIDSSLLDGPAPEITPEITPEIDPSLLNGPDFSPSTSSPAVEALESAGESVKKAALSVEEEYRKILGGGYQGREQVETEGFGDSLKAAQDSIGDSVKAAQEGIDAARDAAAKSLEDVVNVVRGSVDSVGGGVKNAYDSVNGSIVTAIKSVIGPFDKSTDGIQSTVENAAPGIQSAVENAAPGGESVDFTSVFRVGTPANDSLKEFVTVVKSATGSALGAAGDFTSQAYSTAKGNVPSEVQSFLDSAEEKVAQITGPVGSAIDQALVIITDAERAVGLEAENPVIPVVLVVGGTLFLGFSILNSRYGGYSGDLSPSEALDVLKSENAVLVDIRRQEDREAYGIPDLRRSTRSKFAAVEIIKVDGAVRGLLKNTNNLESLLTAAVIRNLKNVNGSSKIIVLDTIGGQSKHIARGLRKSGAKRAYLVDGGFKAWAASGLPVKPEGAQSALSVLQEDAQALVEEVQPTPYGILTGLLATVAGAYALYDWERTLQLIGFLGIASSIYSRASSYESAEDAKADLKLLQKPFTLLIQGIVWIGGLIEPKKLQLATSPVSSNVQGRVIQAAAKHGPKPSELELVGEEPREETVEEPTVDVPAGEEVEGVEGESTTQSTTQSQHTSVQNPE